MANENEKDIGRQSNAMIPVIKEFSLNDLEELSAEVRSSGSSTGIGWVLLAMAECGHNAVLNRFMESKRTAADAEELQRGAQAVDRICQVLGLPGHEPGRFEREAYEWLQEELGIRPPMDLSDDE